MSTGTAAVDHVSPPEPDLTPAEMLRRAQEMRAMLRERQAECEALGCLPDKTNQAFVDAGFYRILQPRRFGGYEFDVPAFVDVMAEVSRGCPSSGWVLALTSGHPHTMSYLSERAQVEAYGAGGEFRAPFVVTPGVFAKPCDGGYVLNGGWDYSSGCDIATHFLGHVLAPPAREGDLPTVLIALIRRDDFTIVDNWDVVGMRGTGSRRVEVKDVFVPDYRTALTPVFRREYLPSIHPNPMYRGRPTSLLMMEITAVSVGLATAALDEYADALRNKRVDTPISPMRFESPEFQRHFGHATALVETARAALRQSASEYMALARRQAEGGAPFGDDDDRRLLLVEQRCCELCLDAVTLTFRTAGSSAGKSSGRLQRYMRDMMFISTHMGLRAAAMEEGYARGYFGLPPLGPV